MQRRKNTHEMNELTRLSHSIQETRYVNVSSITIIANTHNRVSTTHYEELSSRPQREKARNAKLIMMRE